MLKPIVVFLISFACVPAALAQPQPANQPEKSVEITKPPFGAHNRWPVYKFTQYIHNEKYDVHVIGTPTVSPWMMRESNALIEKMIDALKNPEDRAKFAGHSAMLITDEDPSIPLATPGHRNTGGDGFSMFNEELVCAKAVDTIRPDHDPVFRAWYTPVHEFAHAIEHTLKLEKRSDEVFSKHINNYNPKVKREYFCWSVQRWFASLDNGDKRDDMQPWEREYIASIFDEKNTWTPGDTRPPRPDLKGKQAKEQEIKLTPHQLKNLAGRYERFRPFNDWHRGVLTIEGYDNRRRPSTFAFTNDAGRSWLLHADLPSPELRHAEEPSDPDKPHPVYRVAFDTSDGNARPIARGIWIGRHLWFKVEDK